MKKILAAAALALFCGTLFAQAPGGNGPQGGPQGGPGRMGPMGALMGIDWKIGTIVTGEYKKATGTLAVGQTIQPAFTVDGATYSLWLPPIPELGTLKTGSVVTIDGVFVVIKSDNPVPPFVMAFKLTVNGKEYDLRGPGMRGPEGQGRGPQQQ